MLFPEDQLHQIANAIDVVIERTSDYEHRYEQQLKNVHPNYQKSAKNLVHYLALRTFPVDILQEKLDNIGLPFSSDAELSVLNNLYRYKTIINSLLQEPLPVNENQFLSSKEVKKLVKHNARSLFGKIKNKRSTAIMVTQPIEAAQNELFAVSLINQGMDCARINCAHDDEAIWKQIIDNIRSTDSNCRIMMDLGGPKLRTGPMKPGPKVIHIKPKRNELGQIMAPAIIWLAPSGTMPPEGRFADAIIPVNKKWLQKTRKGSYIVFRDSRDKKCKITIDSEEGLGRWGSCNDSAFVITGTFLNVFLEKRSKSEIHTVHELLPLEEVIYLFKGDLLRLDREPILGEPAQFNDEGELIEIAHISCTLPEVFDMVKEHEPVYFNDGKIEGIIKAIQHDHLLIEITGAKKTGGKLRANKGINLPNSMLALPGLTNKDKTDLRFIVQYADAVNFSFVNRKEDIDDLLNELDELNDQIAIILKIETKEAFRNLPGILLNAMQNYPIGVMIARGDLAIEVGWKNFAIIQEEILQLCGAAHIPDVWATQVLENLAKKGVPTRAEITDAAMAQRASCVMLNKGIYIDKAIKMLDHILVKMQHAKKKKKTLLPKLEFKDVLNDHSQLEETMD